MTPQTVDRLFATRSAFDDPLVTGVAIASVGLLAIAPVLIMLVARTGKAGDKLLADLWQRWISWLVLVPSVKRDVGIKDMGSTFPGHGGVLDRFNSLLLVSPAIFHYVGYYLGVGLDQPMRIFTGP